MNVYGVNGRIYDGITFLFTLGKEETFIRECVERLGLRAGDRVLDWGCGTGISLKCIQSLLPSGRIYAVDQSAKMAKYAVSRSRPSNSLEYHFVLRQGVDLLLPEKVNVTVASYSLCTLPIDQFERAIEAIWRNTVPGGQLLILETLIPAAGTAWQSFSQSVRRSVLRRMFGDTLSDALLPTARRFFECTSVEDRPSANGRAFLGRRRHHIVPSQAALQAA